MVQHESHQTSAIKNILIVDDVKEIQDYLSHMLGNLGFWSIDCANSAYSALNCLKANHYDVIFLDIELPDGDGKELLDRISFEFPDAKVVMCSSHNTLENVKLTWEMGAKGFVSKPFDEQKVKTILKRLERS